MGGTCLGLFSVSLGEGCQPSQATNNPRTTHAVGSRCALRLQALPSFYTASNLATVLVPALQKLLSRAECPAAVLPCVVDLYLLLTLEARMHRQRSRQTLWAIQQLANSSSCFARGAFVALAMRVPAFFSHAYFKQNFVPHLLILCSDPVLSVRRQATQQLPRLKALLVLPADRELEKALDAAANDLLTDCGNDQVCTCCAA